MLRKTLYFLLILSALGVAGYAISYFDFEIKSLLQLKGDLINQLWYQILFYSHLAGGSIAISLGVFQFSEKLLRTRPQLHRTIGKIYLGAIAWSGSTGLFISFLAYGGWVAKTGFIFMALGWLFTSAQGYLTVRRGDIAAHQRWMIRSYAFTLGALSFRLWLLGGPLLGIDFLLIYQIASWAASLGNLLIAEILLANKLIGGKPTTKASGMIPNPMH